MLFARHVEELRIDLNLPKRDRTRLEQRLELHEFSASFRRVHHRKGNIAPILGHQGTDDECGQRDLGDHQWIRHERLVDKLVTAVTTRELIVVGNADCGVLPTVTMNCSDSGCTSMKLVQ